MRDEEPFFPTGAALVDGDLRFEEWGGIRVGGGRDKAVARTVIVHGGGGQ